ncbi:GspH/FimT family pseudopilin [Cellvibrio sp.]|uniref:GspH/FimT family pseudopilin n=1 Tax=Cellvibrio sp. TaxID=1965322 RepID=UPI0039647C6B
MQLINRQNAFTLVELLVVLIVMGVVLQLALPNFRTAMSNNRSAGVGGELIAALTLARTEAIKRAKWVSICPTANGSSCGSATDWAKGWIVYVDAATSDTDTTATVLTSTNIIRVWNDLPRGSVITAKKSATNLSYIRFNPSGLLARVGNDTTPRILNAYISNCKGNQQYQISLGIAGMVTNTLIACP